MALKVAIVGMGGIGNTHARCYVGDPLAEIVAVCDIIKERADKAAEAYGCPAFYSVKSMLASGIEIDCASMCTAGKENGGDHYAPTMELLGAGIPTLGEKPISNEVPQSQEDGRPGQAQKAALRRRFEPPVHARRAPRPWLDRQRSLGRVEHDKYAHVDQQPQRDVTPLPHSGASSPFDRRDAVLLRRREKRAGLLPPGTDHGTANAGNAGPISR